MLKRKIKRKNKKRLKINNVDNLHQSSSYSQAAIHNFNYLVTNLKKFNKFNKKDIERYETIIYEAQVEESFNNFLKIDEYFKNLPQPKFYHSSRKKQQRQEELAAAESKRADRINEFRDLTWKIPEHMNKKDIQKLVDKYFIQFEKYSGTVL